MGGVQGHSQGRHDQREPSGKQHRQIGRGRGETGTGLVATLACFLVVLVLLLLAGLVLFDLSARSSVSAAALDAARLLSWFDASGTPAAQSHDADDARRD